MKIVASPDGRHFFDVLDERDLYAVLRNRDTHEQFIVALRDFRQFSTVTHPCVRKES